MTELAFVMAPRQNVFFRELVEAIRFELAELGVASRLSLDGFPEPRRGLVYVLVPPHEYEQLSGGALPAELLGRSVFLCAEQPGSSFFERNAALARSAGALLDLSPLGVEEYRRRGIDSEHFALGYTRAWDCSPLAGGRDVDVCFLGCRSPRRDKLLAGYASSLWRWRSRIVLSDNSFANDGRAPGFVAGGEKRALLRRTRILLNVHVSETAYFETLRVTEAVLAGAVVVTEPGPGMSPFEPGTHLIAGRANALGLLTQALLEDDGRRVEMQRAAFELLREELPMRESVERLVAVAEGVDDHRPARTPATQWRPAPAAAPETESPGPAPVTGIAALNRELKRVKLEQLDARRHLERMRAELDPEAAGTVELRCSTDAWTTARPRVSVLVSLYDYEHHIVGALDSVASSGYRPLELIVVDDASRDDSCARAHEWLAVHQDLPAALLRHPYNRGLPQARNTALGFARGELVFILDADNELYPHGLERLVEALDADPEAAFAYGLLERFDAAGPVGFLSVGPWQPERLRGFNYIDAAAMIRGSALGAIGGYAEESVLHGFEDWDVWCEFAERGWHGVAVEEVVARYRLSSRSMSSLAKLSTSDLHARLVERHPRLMAGPGAAR